MDQPIVHYKTINVAGIDVPMQSFDGTTWHRRSYNGLPTALAWPAKPCVTATMSGRPQSPVKNAERIVKRKKWGPHSLGRKSEGISLLKQAKDREAARRRLEAAQTVDCELCYIDEGPWLNPSRSNPDKSSGFALMGRLLIPQALPTINIKEG